MTDGLSTPFTRAMAEAELDQIVGWIEECGIDPEMEATLLAIHARAAVPGESTADGEPMDAYDWYMMHRDGSIYRYVMALQRAHALTLRPFVPPGPDADRLASTIAGMDAELAGDPPLICWG